MHFLHFSLFSTYFFKLSTIYLKLFLLFYFYKLITFLFRFSLFILISSYANPLFSRIFYIFRTFCYNNISFLLQLCILLNFMFPIFSSGFHSCFLFFNVETVDNFVNNLIFSSFVYKLFTFPFGCYNILSLFLCMILFMCTHF